MSVLIQLKSLSKSYGPTVLFDNVTTVLSSGDKVGVVGRNGAGKTTLCRMLLEEEEPDTGRVVKSPQLRLSYLEQKSPFRAEETVLDFLIRYTGNQDWQCGKVAGRFQLKNKTLETPIGSLPGGYQTRVKLAAMLLRDPNFLVLDEPTNYLDLRTLMLLEHVLRDFSGGFLIVSHDREFLKKTCGKTLDIENGRVTLFPGDVEAYLGYKEERREQDSRYNKNVEAKRKHLQAFVDRNRVRAATASRAQSKMKQLAKLQGIEIEHPASTARIRIPDVPKQGGVALRCSELSIGYGNSAVAKGIHFEIERGEHVAVLGDNGQGKTTFLRTIAGQLAPLEGSFQWGHGLGHAYYAQHVYSSLDPQQDVLTYLDQQAAPEISRQDVLDMAGSFLFHGDDVRKSISVLSGGERARVCLAGLLLSRRPVLLLDEPTNHLDFETVEALAGALRSYSGTLFFISHDRTFVNLVATHIVEVKDGGITLYPGDYETYVYRAEQEIAAEEEAQQPQQMKPSRPPSGATKVSEYELRKERRAARTRLKKRVAEVERHMVRYEEEREAIHRHFLENPTDYSPPKQVRLEELGGLIADAESRWLGLQEELETLEEDES